MTITAEIVPFEQVFGLDGLPLDNGKIYIGTANLDPQYNPVPVFWDAAGTIPAVQPIRTVAGYISYNGAPARIYVNGNYSLRVSTKNDQQVYYVPDYFLTGNQSALTPITGISQLQSYLQLRAYTGSATTLYLTGRTDDQDGASGTFSVDEADTTSADNDGTILVDAIGRRWKRQYSGAVLVEWFGVKGDGVTDNTARYTAMIAALAAGTAIAWRKATYKGDFVSNKAFTLIGNGATLVNALTNTEAVIKIGGAIGAYASLSAAPKYADKQLSGVTGLSGDSMLQLWSGNIQPSTTFEVNHEVLRCDAAGNVYDMVYSDQNGGTPKYAVITPALGVSVDGFNFATSTDYAHGVYVRYSDGVSISNISMVGGSGNTIKIMSCMSVDFENIRRTKPSSTASGDGYNVALQNCKYVVGRIIYGECCRHDYDQDSTYVADIADIVSVDTKSSSVVPAHTGFGGFATFRNLTLDPDINYGLNISSQGSASPDNLLFRSLKIDTIKITSRATTLTSFGFYAIYFAYPTDGVEINNVTVKNINNPSAFNYPNGTFNDSYFIIRAYKPNNQFIVNNVKADVCTSALWIDKATESNIVFNNISVEKFRDIATVNTVATPDFGGLTVVGVTFPDSSTNYGRSICSLNEPTNRMGYLRVGGLQSFPVYALITRIPVGVKVPIDSYIDIVPSEIRTSSINGIVTGNTIKQLVILSRGEFAFWSGSSAVLNATTPFDRPPASGNYFGIYNAGAGTMTIPANSQTVDNVTPISITSGKLYTFIPNGAKWTLMKVETVSLS